ncbi:hypothetical protein BDV93DRAFT_509275 [Ceratobasidium sp. AG-I]|nr:hypothetical protein BDV93DRAFT_509275 [Ceratobasidium sp. AG-I]
MIIVSELGYYTWIKQLSVFAAAIDTRKPLNFTCRFQVVKMTEKALTGYDLANTRNGNLILKGYFIGPMGPESSYRQLKLTIGSLPLIETLPRTSRAHILAITA